MLQGTGAVQGSKERGRQGAFGPGPEETVWASDSPIKRRKKVKTKTLKKIKNHLPPLELSKYPTFCNVIVQLSTGNSCNVAVLFFNSFQSPYR
jgi:hypothetical protein